MSKAARTFDPTSAATVLWFVGGPVEGVPARDLSDNDLARVAWVASKKRPALPADIPADEALALATRLVEIGSYTTSEPAAPAPDSEVKP